MAARPELPASVTDNRIALAGVAAILAAIFAGALVPGLNPVHHALLIMAAWAVTVATLEIVVLRVHRRPSTGIDWSRPLAIHPSRIACKLLGLLATVAVVFAVHALFRIFGPLELSASLHALMLLGPAIVVATVGYVILTDSRLDDPYDSYWTIGAILLGRLPLSRLASLRDHAIGWAIKGFFLPLMFFGLLAYVARADLAYSRIGLGSVDSVLSVIDVILIVDLTIACVGYTLTLRALDAHIRSPNGLLGAWVVTLACYEPFSTLTSRIGPEKGGRDWTDLVTDTPALFVPWAAALLFLYAIWIWATAIYGLRWSNLTNRGIVTGGPYCYTKHPDYVAKSLFFWFLAAPFLTAVDTWMAISGTVALIFSNLIYFGRARMEERHLAEDPVYVEYALAMNERSIFRGVAQLIPALRFRAPGAALPGAEPAAWNDARTPAE